MEELIDSFPAVSGNLFLGAVLQAKQRKEKAFGTTHQYYRRALKLKLGAINWARVNAALLTLYYRRAPIVGASPRKVGAAVAAFAPASALLLLLSFLLLPLLSLLQLLPLVAAQMVRVLSNNRVVVDCPIRR